MTRSRPVPSPAPLARSKVSTVSTVSSGAPRRRGSLAARAARALLPFAVATSGAATAAAQVPPQQPYPQQPPQPYPQAQYPQQPYPQQPQPYPQQPQPQPYPQQPQPYPQQPQPQPYPQQPQPYPQPYPQQYPQPYPQQYPQPYPQQPLPDPRAGNRTDGEFAFLLGTGAGYGVGTGVTLDLLAMSKPDPGLAVIAPIGLGLAVPAGLFAVDYYTPFRKGVPATISTGLLLGAVEGIAISGTQWQLTSDNRGSRWSAGAYGALTFLTATGGGVGGYFWGEFARPDPRTLLFLSSGAAWGALTGTAIGLGASSGGFPRAADPAAILGLLLYNGGIAGTGALSFVWSPSYATMKGMWAGYALGALAGCIVYPFYIGSDADPRHGLIANALGGLGGLALGAALTYNAKDSGQATWKPPFHVGVAPGQSGGATLSAFGEW